MGLIRLQTRKICPALVPGAVYFLVHLILLVTHVSPGQAQRSSPELEGEPWVKTWDQKRIAEIEQDCVRTIQEAGDSPQPSVRLGNALNKLGLIYLQTGRYVDAEPLLRRAASILEKAVGIDDPRLAACLSNLAQLCRKQGKYLEAKRLLERAILIRDRAPGTKPAALARNLCTLAVVYNDLRQFDRAEGLTRRALALLNGSEMEEVDLAVCLNNLAELLARRGEYQEAEGLHVQALSIKEKLLGHDHPQVAQTLNNLAALCRLTGRLTEAKAFCERGLQIRESSLGPSHPDVAESLTELAVLEFAEKRHTEAKRLLQRSLAIREKGLGSEHPDVAKSLLNYATVLRKTHEKAEAKQVEARARLILAAFPALRRGELMIDIKNAARNPRTVPPK